MSDRRAVATPDVPPPMGPYSQAIAGGGYLFCSGQVGSVEGGVGPQTREVMAKLGKVLAADGLTFADVVKTTIYLTDMRDFAAMNAAYAESFADVAPPARSTIGVVKLPRPQGLVEVELIARRR